MIDTVRGHWIRVYRRYPWTFMLMVLLSHWYRLEWRAAVLFCIFGLSLFNAALQTWGAGQAWAVGVLIASGSLGLSMMWRLLIILRPSLAPFVKIEGPIERLDPDGRGGLAMVVMCQRWTVPAAVGQDVDLQQHVRLWVGVSGRVHALCRRELRPHGEVLPAPTVPPVGVLPASGVPPVEMAGSRYGERSRPELWRRVYARSLGLGVRGVIEGAFASTIVYLLAIGCVLLLFLTIQGKGLQTIQGEGLWKWLLIMMTVMGAAIMICSAVLDLWQWGLRIYGWTMPRRVMETAIEHLQADAGWIVAEGLLWELPVDVCQGLSVGDPVRITYRAGSQTVLRFDVGLAAGEWHAGRPAEVRW